MWAKFLSSRQFVGRHRSSVEANYSFYKDIHLLFVDIFPTSKPYWVSEDKVCLILGCKFSKVSLTFLFISSLLATSPQCFYVVCVCVSVCTCVCVCVSDVFPESSIEQLEWYILPIIPTLRGINAFICPFCFIWSHVSRGERKRNRYSLCCLERDVFFKFLLLNNKIRLQWYSFILAVIKYFSS